MPSRPRAVGLLFGPAVPVLVALAVWRPLLRNFFYNDDFVHLFDLITVPFGAFLTQLWGGHLYLVRNAVFALTHAAFGAEPRPFFAIVLATHLLNVTLCHGVVRVATGAPLLACAASILWGVAPVLEGTLGWYSVFGQVLLTTVALTVLLELARRIRSGRALSIGGATIVAVLLGIGAGSFGTGLALVAVAPITSWLALRPSQRSRGALGVMTLVAGTVLGGYGWLRVQTPIVSQIGDPLAPTGVLQDLPAVAELAAHLFGFEASTLLLGTLGIDVAYPSVAATGAAAALLALLCATALMSDATTRRQLIAPAVWLAAAYAAIALGRGHLLQSVHASLATSAAWPRYHYLSLALLVVTVAIGLQAVRRRGGVVGAGATILVGVWTIARLANLTLQPIAIDHHDAERREVGAIMASIGDQARAHAPGAEVELHNRPFRGFILRNLHPGWAAVFVTFSPENAVAGRPIRFIGSEADYALAQSRGGRIAELLRRP